MAPGHRVDDSLYLLVLSSWSLQFPDETEYHNLLLPQSRGLNRGSSALSSLLPVDGTWVSDFFPLAAFIVWQRGGYSKRAGSWRHSLPYQRLRLLGQLCHEAVPSKAAQSSFPVSWIAPCKADNTSEPCVVMWALCGHKNSDCRCSTGSVPSGDSGERGGGLALKPPGLVKDLDCLRHPMEAN